MTTKIKNNDPIESIEGIHNLTNGVKDLYLLLLADAEKVAGQWEQLKRIGAAREDHAAALMGTLRVRLTLLASFATRCHDRIAEMEADPFGRNEE